PFIAAPAWSGSPAAVSHTASQARAAEAAKLHLILLADESDGYIGANCAKDIDAVRRLFQGAGADRREPGGLVVHDLTGDEWTPERVLCFLNHRVLIGPNESVLVFHSGHGGIRDRDQPYESFYMQLNCSKGIRRTDVRQALERHHPRSLIM